MKQITQETNMSHEPIKKNRWVEDCLMLVDRETRAKIKILAIKNGQTVKTYLRRMFINK